MLESEDNDLDLSEADFAPARCSGLLQPCAVNGNEFDNAAFGTAVSDVTFPVHEEGRLMDGDGVLGNHKNVTSSSVQNIEASCIASVHYDAIGLPLCRESSPSHEAVVCQNSVLLEAAESSNNHVVKNDLDSDMVSSNNTLCGTAVTTDGINSAWSVSSVKSACLSVSDRQSACEDDKELDSCLRSDGNTAYEKSELAKSGDENEDSRINSLNADNEPECAIGSSEEPSQQVTETINSDITDSRAPVDEFSDIPISNAQDVIMSQATNQVHGEEMAVACGDSCVTELSPVITEETDDLDDGIDEVDKTVPYLYKMHSNTTSRDRSFEAGVQAEDHSHLLDSKKKSTDLASGDSSWVEKEFDETCGIDHVERITAGRAKVKLDSCTEVHDVDNAECFSVKCISESDIVDSACETSEVAAVSEMVSYAKDAMTSRVSMQSDVLDTNHPAASLPCLASTAEVIGSNFSQLQEIPVDIVDEVYDVPEAVDSLQKHVSEDASMSHIDPESGAVRDLIQSLSANDAGRDSENAELHQKQSNGDGGGSLTVTINGSITVDAEPSSQNETSLTTEFPDDENDEGLDTPSAVLSVEPDMQEVGLPMLSEKDAEQEKCGFNSNIGSQIDASVNGDSLPVARAVDDSSFDAGISAGIDNTEKDKSVVYTRTEGQTLPTDGTPSQDQQQSAEDAEKWFEEQFAACEDFDVDEFVSSAWSTFHSDAEPAVNNVHNEMLEQTLAGNHREPVQLDTADAWQYVENAAVAGSAVDDSYQQPSAYTEYLDSEMETATGYPPSSSEPDMTETVPSLPGIY